MKKHIDSIQSEQLNGKSIPLDDKPIDYVGDLKNTVTINENIIEPIDIQWEELS